MDKGYKRIILTSFVMAAITIGYGFITSLQGPNLSMYAHYTLVGGFAYSQWGLLANVKQRWITPIMLVYTFLVAYMSQFPISYIDDDGIFFMSLAATVCGYGFYAAKHAALTAEPMFIDANPAKRVRGYIVWNMKAMIAAFIFGLSYWVYAEAIGFVIATLWAIIFAGMLSWKFIKVYSKQEENLNGSVQCFPVLIAQGVIGSIALVFLIGVVVVVSQFSNASTRLQAIGLLITTGALLVTAAIALWSSDTE